MREEGSDRQRFFMLKLTNYCENEKCKVMYQKRELRLMVDPDVIKKLDILKRSYGNLARSHIASIAIVELFNRSHQKETAPIEREAALYAVAGLPKLPSAEIPINPHRSKAVLPTTT